MKIDDHDAFYKMHIAKKKFLTVFKNSIFPNRFLPTYTTQVFIKKIKKTGHNRPSTKVQAPPGGHSSISFG